jgi:hypothetical protein
MIPFPEMILNSSAHAGNAFHLDKRCDAAAYRQNRFLAICGVKRPKPASWNGVNVSESPSTMPIRFTLTEELAVKAAVLTASRYTIRFLWFALIVGLLTSAFFIVTGARWEPQRALLQAFLTMAGAVVIVLLINLLMRYWIYPFYARRNFRQQKALSEEMSLSWTDKEFLYTTGKSRTEMLFANLHGYRASGEVILLYLSDAIYYVIPVDAFGSIETSGSFMRKLEEAGLRRL